MTDKMVHTLDNADQQRNLMKAHALLTMAIELILDNATWEASTIEEDMGEVQEFVEERIDDRLLAMNSESNPYYDYLHSHVQKGGGLFPLGIEANLTVALGLIRGTEFQKEESDDEYDEDDPITGAMHRF